MSRYRVLMFVLLLSLPIAATVRGVRPVIRCTAEVERRMDAAG